MKKLKEAGKTAVPMMNRVFLGDGLLTKKNRISLLP